MDKNTFFQNVADYILEYYLSPEHMNDELLTKIIRDYYKKILNHFNMDYNYYVLENNDLHINTREPYYLETNIKYTNLLKDTIYDIEQYQNTIS